MPNVLRIDNFYNFYLNMGGYTGTNCKKRGQATYIAPLQPPTLAAFRPWGDSVGAGRIRLAHTNKSNTFYGSVKIKISALQFLLYQKPIFVKNLAK